ncbi:MAG TPA: WD40 repeat domain-containing protein [bacterium]|nr:WD40 repeat domain-containing protein [bacterium]
MREKLLSLFLLGLVLPASGANWFEKNQELQVIYPASVWRYVVKANQCDDRGQRQQADAYLRLVLRLTQEAKPFAAGNWPKNWPYDLEALKLLRYGSPEAYTYRLIGDFALKYNRYKEAISHYRLYLEKSYLPDASVMQQLALLLEREGLLQEALLTWSDLQRNLEINHYHGQPVSSRTVIQAMKRLETRLRRTRMLILDAGFNDIPDYLQSGFNQLYRETVSSIKGIEVIAQEDLTRIMTEEAIAPAELEDEEELARVGKMLNASLVVRGFLSYHEANYLLLIRLFDPQRKVWFSEYEYRNQDFRYLPVLLRRFTYAFLEEPLPGDLLLPQSQVMWSYETDSDITDIRVSSDGNYLICGTENGTVYLLNRKGSVILRKKMNERITKVGISPDGRFACWACLNGKVYFQGLKSGGAWNYPFDNLVRGLVLAEDGSFLSAGVNNVVYFLDRKGVIFWKSELGRWISSLAISPVASRVAVGLEDGSLLNYSEEGNLRWQARLNGPVVRLNFSPRSNYLAAESDKGEVSVFDDQGKIVLSLVPGEDKKFTAFFREIISAVVGRRGQYFYFLSPDGEKLWNFHVDEKTAFLEAAGTGENFVAGANKNIFYLQIKWE